jgi:hypothetical protein
LPDGLSEIFFARDLDRANQLDVAGEFSFEAQRRGRPQRVNPATPLPRYRSAPPARRPPCTSVSTSAAAPIFGEVADADVAPYGSPRAEQAPGRSSLSLKMGTRRPDVSRHSGLRLAEVGFVRLAAHCFPVSDRAVASDFRAAEPHLADHSGQACDYRRYRAPSRTLVPGQPAILAPNGSIGKTFEPKRHGARHTF